MIFSFIAITSLSLGYTVLETGCIDELLYSAPTTIQIDRDTLSLGKMRCRETKMVTFHIRNTGDVPLLIVDVRASGGCSSVSWNKRPVNPGQEVEITVGFEPDSLGHFLKSIEVVCNTRQHVHQLNLRGTVVE